MRAQGIMYKEVAHSVILYGSEIWVVTGYMLKVLKDFHHQAVRRIMGVTVTHGVGWDW